MKTLTKDQLGFIVAAIARGEPWTGEDVKLKEEIHAILDEELKDSGTGAERFTTGWLNRDEIASELNMCVYDENRLAPDLEPNDPRLTHEFCQEYAEEHMNLQFERDVNEWGSSHFYDELADMNTKWAEKIGLIAEGTTDGPPDDSEEENDEN
jgi:hypothetical protein